MHFDIVVIGAGPAGLAFARLLNKSGLKIGLLERQSTADLEQAAVDGRDIALTYQSREILEALGVWQRIDPLDISPLMEARVIDGDSPYLLDFAGPGEGQALGWLVSNHLLRRALYLAVESLDNVELMTEVEVIQVASSQERAEVMLADGRCISAELVVAADTRFSQSRRQMGIAAEINDFGRTAIVCRMQHEKPHQNIAWECFHYGRTLAMLPMPGHASSAVITVPANAAPAILEMNEAEFSADVTQRFAARLGRMQLTGERFAYPLVAVHAKRFVGDRFALLGDAAVGMHPVTAHGFNLGLSGAQCLADVIQRATRLGGKIASSEVLNAYERQHRLSTLPLFHGTNMLVKLFTDDHFPANLLRKAVVHASNHLPPVKWAIRNKLTAKQGVRLPPGLRFLPRLP